MHKIEVRREGEEEPLEITFSEIANQISQPSPKTTFSGTTLVQNMGWGERSC